MIFSVLCTGFGVAAAFAAVYTGIAVAKERNKPPLPNNACPACIFYGATATVTFVIADAILLLTRVGLSN